MSEECFCRQCGNAIPTRRSMLGYATCLDCGEVEARQVKHCIVPMPKSNYIVVSDLSLLLGLNSSHKGGTK